MNEIYGYCDVDKELFVLAILCRVKEELKDSNLLSKSEILNAIHKICSGSARLKNKASSLFNMQEDEFEKLIFKAFKKYCC